MCDKPCNACTLTCCPGGSLSAEACSTQEEMQNAKLDLAWRDFCAHLLIPLNQCRRNTFWMPWKCGHERHAYEMCQYKEFKRRVAQVSAKA